MAIATYTDDNQQRLVSFTHADPGTNGDRIAYLKITASNGPNAASDINMLTDVIDGSPIKADLQEIHGELVGANARYQKFILSGIQTSRQERTQIIPTFGDSFAAVFTGRDPMVISVSGSLIFDSSSGTQSMTWYHAFINAYEYMLRGSRLAKWWAVAKLVIPDMTGAESYDGYTGYIISLSESHSAENDNVIPISFSMLVTHQPTIRPMVKETGSGDTTGTGVTADPQTKVLSDTTIMTPITTVTTDLSGTPAATIALPGAASTVNPTDVHTQPAILTPVTGGITGNARPIVPTTITAAVPPPSASVAFGKTADAASILDQRSFKVFTQSLGTVLSGSGAGSNFLNTVVKKTLTDAMIKGGRGAITLTGGKLGARP